MEPHELSYADAPVAVREDLVAAHRRAWQRISRPGVWWSGGERVAIAAETRQAPRCALCRERKAAVSPAAVTGQHAGLGALPDALVDVVHRVRTDPGRLTRRWYRGLLADGLAETHYVEAVGVVVSVVGMDTFARGLGVPPRPLPKPAAGEPTRVRPPQAKLEDAWVPMIAADATEGPEADLYGSKQFVPNVRRALSLVPAEARGFADLGTAHYFSLDEMMELGRRPTLSRPQIELVASRVSALNECFY